METKNQNFSQPNCWIICAKSLGEIKYLNKYLVNTTNIKNGILCRLVLRDSQELISWNGRHLRSFENKYLRWVKL